MEREKVLAFRDTKPQAPVHLLVIPKEHIVSVLDLNQGHQAVLSDMIQAAQELSKLEGVDASGFRLVFNCGPDAGQSVDHLHMHLLGQRNLAWPPG